MNFLKNKLQIIKCFFGFHFWQEVGRHYALDKEQREITYHCANCNKTRVKIWVFGDRTNDNEYKRRRGS